MIVRVLEIDRAEARDLVGDFAARQQAEGVNAGNFLLECELGAGHQADRDIGFADRREAPGDRVGEFCRYQLVSDLGRSAREVLQTIVTHGRSSCGCEHPPWGFWPPGSQLRAAV